MIIGYIRVSTALQNLQSQREACSAAGCDRIFEETASGAQTDRPILAEVMRMLRPGDELVVFKLDRLARSTRQLIQTVDELEQRQVKLKSLTEMIDTGSPSGRLFFHIMSSISEFERSNLRERVRVGIESARARGRVGGRPPSLSDEDVRAARALLKDGSIPVGEVARRLGVGTSTLYRHIPGGRSAA